MDFFVKKQFGELRIVSVKGASCLADYQALLGLPLRPYEAIWRDLQPLIHPLQRLDGALGFKALLNLEFRLVLQPLYLLLFYLELSVKPLHFEFEVDLTRFQFL